LEAKDAVPPKRLGALKSPGFVLTDAFWGPLPEEELRLWNADDSLEENSLEPSNKLGTTLL
jgi:hypothetical protein